IQDRPVLGGNNSSEARVWLNGETGYQPYPRVGDLVAELDQARRGHPGTADMYEDEKKIALVLSEPNLSLFLNCRANEVEMDADRIVAVIAQNTADGRRLRFPGRWFADCTGDGCIGFLAGADYEMTVPDHMGQCNLWIVTDTGTPVSFPRLPWAIDLWGKPFPTALGDLGKWFWESGFPHDPIEKGEYIRDTNFRAAYGAWDALKNEHSLYPNHKLAWMAHISGKRESRRLLGDVILTEEDLLNSVTFPDGCVPASWTIDVHFPDTRYVQGFEDNPFLATTTFGAYPRPYWVPYRCLYSRNVPNLFMAGRDISVTHRALGTVAGGQVSLGIPI
ncbi:FAD-dependent oxidoreductase, partial [bacterium]|nr:FAD-dependent oxidoreductase [bacterium]